MSAPSSVAFSLGAAATWGAGDFAGGLAAKRTSVFAVLVATHTSGIALLAAIALFAHEAAPARAALLWGASAGLCGAVGLAALYRALSVGRMGIAAPVAAVLTAVLPVAVGIASVGAPPPHKLIGFALAAAGIWLIARGESGAAAGVRRFPPELPLALLAGAGFSAYLVLTQRAGAATVLWPLVAARAASLLFGLCAALLLRSEIVPRDRRALGLALLSGLFDAGGNALYVLATHTGRLDVTSVLASLYPVSTVLLARLVLRERFSRLQLAGMAAALVAIPLIAA